MAESKFLKYQDVNGDKLIDACEEFVEVAEAAPCPECIPNPYATVPDWKQKTVDEPFFNEKECLFHVTVVTEYTDTMDSSLLENEDTTEEEAAAGTNVRFDEYVNEALESLLVNYDKNSSEGSILSLRESVEYTDFDLDARPNSRLKLLFTVPYESLVVIDDAEDEDEEEEDEEPEPAGTTVTYETDKLRANLIKVRKGLRLYNRYLKVFRSVEGGNILKEKNNSVFNLETYGDSRLFKNSTLGSILTEVDAFLNKRKMNIVGFGSIGGLFQDRVTKIEFQLNKNYKLIKMRVWTAGCNDKPRSFGKKKLKSLNARSSFKDSTAMAYFSKIEDMLTDLEAREPMGWIEFVTTHTYPPVYDTFDTNRADAPTTSCISAALQDEAKQLGQDLLDSDFSIGDALAYAYKKANCLNELGELEQQDIELGLSVAPDATTHLVSMSAERRKSTPYDQRRQISMVNRKRMMMMAKEQAFKTLEDDDIVFTKWCASLLGVEQNDSQESKSGAFNIEDAFKKFDELKLCGLFDLLKEAIGCLLGGLTLEQAMGKIAESALKAMSVENFSDLFVGLPPEVQEKLGTSAMSKLESGDVFQDQSTNQEISNTITEGGPVSNATLPLDGSETAATSQKSESRRSLAQKLDGGYTAELDQNVLIQAYIAALIEHYSGDMLELIDKLNKYPGAQMIANTIAFFDCPQDPMMDPGIFDFIKSVELPMCRNGWDITMPKLANPFGWIPEVKDWWGILFQLLKQALQQLIISIIIKLFVKICGVISDSMCKALETAGDLIASIPSAVAGRSNFRDTIRETICGDAADEDELDDTISDLFDSLGSGASALSDQEQLNNFVGDVSSSTTQAELYEAMLGDASYKFLELVDSLIEYEYQVFRESFPNKEAISNFFKNVGNLMPADAKAAIQDAVTDPASTKAPANPSLCYTEDQWDDFCELRQNLLAGRATPEQISAMCENMRDGMADDLGELSDALQQGFGPDGLGGYIGSQMPPLTSDPGCDNGLIPFESEEAASAASFALSNDFEKLKVAFSTDMLGNGPGEKNWGLINMILSDTMGNPLTAHYRKSFLQPGYVDFATDTGDRLDFEELLSGRVLPTPFQRGTFPAYVAEWLQYQLEGTGDATDLKENLNFSSNNDWQTQTVSSATFENLGIINNVPLVLTAITPGLSATTQLVQSMTTPDFKYYELPNLGYNIKTKVDMENEKVKFVKKGRKGAPDVTLSFKDNAKGLRTGMNAKDSAYGYGFKIELFFSDLQRALPPLSVNVLGKIGDTNEKLKTINNVYSDNVRILITEDINPGAKYEREIAALLPFNIPAVGDDNDTEYALSDRKFEFLAEDTTLSEFNLSSYTNFNESFSTQKSFIPQVTLLHEILEQNGADYLEQEVKDFHDEFMNIVFDAFIEKVANNTPAFAYGAEYDNLTRDDVDYVIPYNTPNISSEYWGTPYGEALIEDEELDDDGNVIDTYMRKIINDDMILGISRMQYQIDREDRDEKNRVFYLDPTKFGGKYMNPPVFIKPKENKGWIGFIDVLFPELSPCKPQRTDLVDFEEIQDVVDEAYRNMPEDERLQHGESDCVEELPYHRILERSNAAGLEGLITAAIRIYVTAHMVKSLATFSVFKPVFPDVYSDIYAQYIVESMQESFAESDPDASDRLGIYSDEEFWFGFLEQAVQMYARRIDSGEIVDPPQPVLDALFKLNDMQEGYNYPSRRDLRDAKEVGEVRKIKTLKNYREEKNYNAIYKTQDLSKKILKELVVEQLNYMGDTLVKNLEVLDTTPEVSDILYYVLNNMVQGASLKLYPPFIEESEEIPTVPYLEDPTVDAPYYTGGGEFSVYEIRSEETSYSKGDEYVGYYHAHIDEDGNLSYMEGPEHVSGSHNLLKPFANKMVVPIGSVADYGYEEYENDNSRPFVIEKYISINNVKYSSTDAITKILNNEDQTQNISDVYPGTLEQTLNATGERVVGLTGELGVRYGLLFSMAINGIKTVVTAVEVDVLDLPLSQFVPLEDDSKNLLCLINMLKKDEKFNMITRYIFPFNKVISAIAIYNDMAFLPSIGEVTVADDSTYGRKSDFGTKPGMRIITEDDEDDEGNITSEVREISSNAGWSSLADRNPGPFAGLFVNEWDSWDREILRKSKKRIKKMFKAYYKHGWNLKAGNLGDLPRPGSIFLGNLKDRLKPSAGKKLLPWWKRRRLRTNPFDSKGNICEKE